jgi:hypothetical protein
MLVLHKQPYGHTRLKKHHRDRRAAEDIMVLQTDFIDKCTNYSLQKVSVLADWSAF